MCNPILSRTACAAAVLSLGTMLPAFGAQTVFWPSLAITPAGIAAPALISAPDLVLQVDPARAVKFEQRVDYPTLAATMGLSATTFAQYDVILWENNGGSPAAGGFESTSFVFDDFVSAVTARYDEISNSSDNPAVQFLTGSISGAQYDATFGTVGAAPVMSWLLIDVPDVINVHSLSFNVLVTPGGPSVGGLGQGSPDIDAIGVITSVPEPAGWGLVALGLAALGRRPRRRSPTGR